MTGSVRPASLGEVAPAGPIRHGTISGYQTYSCRCPDCVKAKRTQRRRGSVRVDMTAEEAKYCQVCWVKLDVHPFKACWRDL